LKQGLDLIGDLLRSFDAIVADDAQLKELSTLLRPLGIKTGVELAYDEADFSDRAQLCRWLQEDEADLLSRLTEGLE
jgi:hypothetical protein